MTDSALFRDSATGDLRDASGPVTIGGGPPSGTAGGALDGTYPNPGLAAAVAGAGLAETSDVLSVNVDGTTIEINTDALRVKSGVFDASGAAAAAQAASQPLDADLTAIAALDASTAGAIASDGAGWIKKTYAQFKTALSLVKGDVGLGNVDNTADASKVVASAAILTTARTIDGQSFDGSGNITVIAPGTHAATGKTTPVDADELALVDSAASNVLKKLTWANVKATLKTYFDPLYMAAGASATPSGAAGGDLNGTYPDPLVDAGLFGGVAWTVVTKASDESVASSIVLQNDDELFFTAASGGLYEFDLVLVYASPVGGATPDLKCALGEDSSVRGSCIQVGLNSADAATGGALLTNQTATFSFGTAAANRIGRAFGVHQGAGGTFRLLWSQNTSGTNATIVRAGSVLRYRRIV